MWANRQSSVFKLKQSGCKTMHNSFSQWTLKKKVWTLFSLQNMESPKVQKVSHWLSEINYFKSIGQMQSLVCQSKLGNPTIPRNGWLQIFLFVSFRPKPLFESTKATTHNGRNLSTLWDLKADFRSSLDSRVVNLSPLNRTSWFPDSHREPLNAVAAIEYPEIIRGSLDRSWCVGRKICQTLHQDNGGDDERCEVHRHRGWTENVCLHRICRRGQTARDHEIESVCVPCGSSRLQRGCQIDQHLVHIYSRHSWEAEKREISIKSKKWKQVWSFTLACSLLLFVFQLFWGWPPNITDKIDFSLRICIYERRAENSG